jgi:hypothetical protein
MNYVYISLIKRRDTLYQIYNKKCFAKPFRLSFLCIQGARVNGYIIHIGDSVQYFGFNKQVLVQTKKEMHTVVKVICLIILYCRSQTILYDNTPSYTWC